MKDLIFLSAQPDDNYFAWQLEVQINNFRKFGYSDKMHVVLFKAKDRQEWNPIFEELERRYPEVKFFRYEDKGAAINMYIPILRPHALKQHFKAHPELAEKAIFYHDSDIIFSRPLQLEGLINGDTWYLSDTNSYIGYKYFESKEAQVKEFKKPLWNIDKVLEPILNSVGISVDQFKAIEGNAGGAQYILKDIDYKFWDKVENDCLNIYLYFKTTNAVFFNSENEGIQRWCADMWAILWNGIRLNKDIKVSRELDFSWATDAIETFERKPIYHNAGSTGKPNEFYKGKYASNQLPWNDDFSNVSPDLACYAYLKELLEVRDKYYKKAFETGEAILWEAIQP